MSARKWNRERYDAAIQAIGAMLAGEEGEGDATGITFGDLQAAQELLIEARDRDGAKELREHTPAAAARQARIADKLRAETVAPILATAGPGLSVFYRQDDGTEIPAVTRGEPWRLGDRTWVVLLEGRAGGYAVSRIRIADAAPKMRRKAASSTPDGAR